jgi:3-oxoacyl-[acyl-carrier-protein] synthase-1
MSVFIAGKGIVTAIGMNVNDTLSSLLRSESGIGAIKHLKSAKSANFPAGEVPYSNEELAVLSGLPVGLPRTAYLSSVAARQALNDAGVPDIEQWRTGFISATTVGGMDLTEVLMKHFFSGELLSDINNILYHDNGSVTDIVSNQLGIKQYVTTVSTACSSSANAIMLGAKLINHNKLDVVVAGGADALSLFTLNGFSSLMILDEKPCTPFDDNRKGLNLGEGAAYVVLVSDKVASLLGKKCSVKLSGYANANDAFHATASSPDGKGNYLAMQGAFDMSGITAGQIGYINLHGTGTANNDLSEGLAVQRAFGKNVPPASSTKSFTGHTLGASGAVEAVISCLCIEHDFIPANLRLSVPMKELDFVPVAALKQGATIDHVLSNSFGFGGNCSSLIFSKA